MWSVGTKENAVWSALPGYFSVAFDVALAFGIPILIGDSWLNILGNVTISLLPKHLHINLDRGEEGSKCTANVTYSVLTSSYS